MAKYKVVYNPTTFVARVLDPAAGPPADFIDLGVINHDPSHITDREDPLKHVLYQSVQNKVYLSGVRNFDQFTIKIGL